MKQTEPRTSARAEKTACCVDSAVTITRETLWTAEDVPLAATVGTGRPDATAAATAVIAGQQVFSHEYL